MIKEKVEVRGDSRNEVTFFFSFYSLFLVFERSSVNGRRTRRMRRKETSTLLDK